MTIEEIKEALREVRRICTEARFCKNCPLAIDGSCPLHDDDGEAVDYPEEWPLEWEDEKP